MAVGPLIVSGLLSGSTITLAVAETTPATGPDYSGIALLISAVAALVTAVGGVILGLRKSGTDDIDEELRRLMLERLRAEEDEQ